MSGKVFDPRTTALFLDIDGTLLDIAATPNDVSVPPDLIRHLRQVSTCFGGALALVSGRTIAVIDDLLRPARFKAAGAHGAELRLSDDGDVREVAGCLPDALRGALRELAVRVPGVLIEDKSLCLAVHYREVPTAGDALLAALETLIEEADEPSLDILPGRLVFEIKHAAHDKGTAVDAFMAVGPFRGRMPVFIGDDVTDAAAFAVMAGYGGAGYSVGRDFPHAQRGFETPADVRAWLAELAGRADDGAASPLEPGAGRAP